MAARTLTEIEPRVVRLETSIESLTSDVRVLADTVREQGKSNEAQMREQGRTVETQIQSLMVAVTAASGPRKTDWQIVLASVGLIMAIGAAAFSPMLLRINSLASDNERLEGRFLEHEKLELHPVGKAKIDAVTVLMNEHWRENAVNIEKLDAKLQKEFGLITDIQKESSKASDRVVADLDTRLQREFGMAGDNIKRTADEMKASMDLRFVTLTDRVKVLEGKSDEYLKLENMKMREQTFREPVKTQ